MKKIVLTLLLGLLSITSLSLDSKELKRLNSKMEKADYFKKEQRYDKKIYLRGSKTPFTGTFVLKVGNYLEYTEQYENGFLSGDKTWYDINENIMMIETYKNGIINGEQITYYPNGKERSIINYKDKKITEVDWYSISGKALFEEKYKNGTGNWKTFWENGVLQEKGQYSNFLKDGKWIKYNKDGKINEIKIYKNNRLIGRSWSE
ncbi:MAG: toxin-antitoxin system YwqK family antitoxin [Fusobacteriaceae bacterium]